MKTTPRTHPDKVLRLRLAPRCLAKTRRGTQCQCPAVRNRPRCRFHGCAKGSGAPRGNQNALTHGQTTSEIKSFRRSIKVTLQTAKNLTQLLN